MFVSANNLFRYQKAKDFIRCNDGTYTKLINEKVKADAPIATYKNMDVQKGVGRFGPFIKWNGMFIKYKQKV